MNELQDAMHGIVMQVIPRLTRAYSQSGLKLESTLALPVFATFCWPKQYTDRFLPCLEVFLGCKTLFMIDLQLINN